MKVHIVFVEYKRKGEKKSKLNLEGRNIKITK